MPLLQSINAKRFRTFGEMALDIVKNQSHRRETIMLESDQLEKTEPFQQ
jgi:hypothetical protein